MLRCFRTQCAWFGAGEVAAEKAILHKTTVKRRILMNRQLVMYRRWFLVVALMGILLALPLVAFSKTGNVPDAAVSLKTAITEVAERNIPAVVHIEVTQRQEVTNPFLPFENDPFFHYFFENPKMPKKFRRELKGLGSGMIMDSEGHILTNNHVVGGASKIQVLLSDGEEYPAKLVGADPKTDLAVIKIDAKKPLPHVNFGDSDKLKVGEWVVAIGHPRGLDETVTQGIISAKHRQGITDPSSYQDFLQTDAAINPGNSGGPLLNLEGEVIGVNAAIASQSGGFEGIGFAIPSNMALHVAKALIATGKVQRGWLGVSIQELTPELAKSFGLDRPKGALIADVVKGGPADKAGLQRGDIVLVFGGKDVPNVSEFRNAVANTPVGQEVPVTVLRKGQSQTLTVKIGSMEGATRLLATSLKDKLGAEFRALTPKEVEGYGINPDQGAAVVWLEPNGPLAKVGFEVGDAILEVNGQAIEGVQGLVDAVSALRAGTSITLLALDHNTGKTGYVQIVVG
jgi:serine protease Do